MAVAVILAALLRRAEDGPGADRVLARHTSARRMTHHLPPEVTGMVLTPDTDPGADPGPGEPAPPAIAVQAAMRSPDRATPAAASPPTTWPTPWWTARAASWCRSGSSTRSPTIWKQAGDQHLPRQPQRRRRQLLRRRVAASVDHEGGLGLLRRPGWPPGPAPAAAGRRLRPARRPRARALQRGPPGLPLCVAAGRDAGHQAHHHHRVEADHQ